MRRRLHSGEPAYETLAPEPRPGYGGEAVLLALGRTIELRDRLTRGHCERLTLYSLALGKALALNSAELLALYQGSYLHDIGKVAVPDSILFKPSALNEQEWATMRQHPVIGESICRGLEYLAPVLPIIRNHHEKWDGSGYPDGLHGGDTPLLARVLQMADIYDALISERPYKRPCTSQQALSVMWEQTDRGWRDPELMELLNRVHWEIDHAESRMAASLAELHKRVAE